MFWIPIELFYRLLFLYFQALIGLAFSIGFIIGPLAGAWFAKNNDLWGEKPAFYALSLSLANVALVALFIPETLSKVCIMIFKVEYMILRVARGHKRVIKKATGCGFDSHSRKQNN